MMGCGMHKSSIKYFSKSDLLELQKYPEELNEKRIKVLKWMQDDDLELKTTMNDYNKINWKKIKENQQVSNWQEAWQREQELVRHPSVANSCESKILCITLIDEDLRIVCNNEEETF